jgi:hypothetical protein
MCDGKPAGIISIRDLVKYRIMLQQNDVENLTSYVFRAGTSARTGGSGSEALQSRRTSGGEPPAASADPGNAAHADVASASACPAKAAPATPPRMVGAAGFEPTTPSPPD